METKRCPYCHKLQRADAQICSRCGYTFLSKRPGVHRRDESRPSNPPASPHRAGHYAGLHPEDQPYQSSKIAVQRPFVPQDSEWRRPLHEPERIVLPSVDEEEEETLPVVSRPVVDKPSQPSLPSAFPEKEGFVFFAARPVSVILALACLFFLLASSIIAFALISKSSSVAGAEVSVTPNVVHVNDTFLLSGQGFTAHHWLTFTYDFRHTIFDSNQRPLQVQVGDDGSFAVAIRTSDEWGTGRHSIHVVDASQQSSISTTITIEQSPANQPQLQLSMRELLVPSE